MDKPPVYDYIVVGAGLIGSAAAKYITLLTQNNETEKVRVALVGPAEPKKKSEATLHGAHYDEARIAAKACDEDVWGLLTARSIDRYRDIEKQSGLSLYTEVGFVSVGSCNEDFINGYKAYAEAEQIEHESLETSDELRTAFPYMDFGRDVQGLYTKTDSGCLNPRRLVQAQIQISEENGCDIFRDVVESIQHPNDCTEYYTLYTESGRLLTTKKVLLCTGAFTHCKELLPSCIIPNIIHHPNSVILVEIDDTEREVLKGMPCVYYKGGPFDKPVSDILAYILPPVKYPDDKYYLKLGHGDWEPQQLETPEEITRWYWGGKQQDVDDELYEITKALFPGLKMNNYKYDYCVTANTPRGYPYVDMVQDCMGIAVAGCGQSAMCSDELGRMAARLIVKGSWDHKLPKELFMLQKCSENDVKVGHKTKSGSQVFQGAKFGN